MPFLEIFPDSRRIFISQDSCSEEFVFCIWNDPDNPEYDPALLNIDPPFFPNTDLQATEYFLSILPLNRIIVAPDGSIIDLYLQSVEVNEKTCVGPKQKHEGRAIYSSNQQDIDTCSISYNTRGGTEKITQSFEIISSDNAPGVSAAPNMLNAIGVTHNDIEGATIERRGMEFQVTAYLPAAFALSFGYGNLIYQLSKTMNIAPFGAFAPGEVLFRGAYASGTFVGNIPVTYEFRAIPTVSGRPDPPFSPLFKLGHDYVDYRYQDTDAMVDLIKLPYWRYVHRVYEFGDFTLLGIPC